jgi:hypothetical protein
MSYRKRAFVVFAGILFLMTPVLAQKMDPPSSRFVTYREPDLEIRFPDNWIATKTGDTVTLSPEEGNVEGTLAYGLLMEIFEPRRRDSYTAESIPAAADVIDLLLEELKQTRPNLRVLRRVDKEIGGLPAVEVEMNNTSPLGGLEVDRLLAVRRPNEKLRYFLAVSPQAEANRYNSIFSRMIESIRLYN